MMTDDGEGLLRYYKSELAYLRRMGSSFARRYPKLAGRLELSAHGGTDPHVERLIESFAFLTARIQRQLDSQFPQITTALLGVLYPHLVNPLPSAVIAKLEVDPKQGKLTTGFTLPKNTSIFSQTTQGLTCRFSTCYPVTLWPVEVVFAAIETIDESAEWFKSLNSSSNLAGVLRLRIAATGAPLRELALRRLRFHLYGSSTAVDSLYELLFAQVDSVVILPDNNQGAVFLPPESILPVGFGADEEVLPYPAHAQPAYRLLQEYFFFPHKFHFVDIDGIDTGQSGQWLDILILLKQTPAEEISVDRNTFVLGCTPVVNLFRKTAEPIRLDHRTTEYRLVPDIRRERTTEIHSILSVSASSNPLEEDQILEPFFSFRHRMDGKEPAAFWHARREPASQEDRTGTEMFLSFVDLNFDPNLPPLQTVFAHTLCTNRELARELPAGALLQTDEPAPLAGAYCLRKPTPPAYPPLEGATLWALISNLSLNHLSLSGGKESLEALREILRLYGFPARESTQQQIEGIKEMSCRRVARRVGTEAWRGFCQGTEVTLVLDEEMFVGGGAFLLGAVLQEFLSLYSSVNSFTQLVIRKYHRDAEWKKWPPLLGSKPML